MASVTISTMVSVVLTVHPATGHGLPTTLLNGNQKMLIVAVQLLISKKFSLVMNAKRQTQVFVVNTVVSVAGHGTPTTKRNGLVKALIVGARIGGENDQII